MIALVISFTDHPKSHEQKGLPRPMKSKFEQSLFDRYKEHVLGGRLTGRQSFWLLIAMDEISENPQGTFAAELDFLLHCLFVGRDCLKEIPTREAAAQVGLSQSSLRWHLGTWNHCSRVSSTEPKPAVRQEKADESLLKCEQNVEEL